MFKNAKSSCFGPGEGMMALESKDESFRDWANLSWDVLYIIFEKLGPVEIIAAPELVCKPWWRLAHEPQLWKSIKMFDEELENELSVTEIPDMTCLAIDRSDGCLEEFRFCHLGSPEVLKHIVKRCTKLKRLHLDYCDNFSDELMKACKRFPLLEYLYLEDFYMTEEVIKSISNSCPNLKTLRFIHFGRTHRSLSNEVAFAIAENMCGLHELEIGGDRLDDDGVLAVLDGCPHLVYFCVSECYQIYYNDELTDRLEELGSLKFIRNNNDQYGPNGSDDESEHLHTPFIYLHNEQFDNIMGYFEQIEERVSFLEQVSNNLDGAQHPNLSPPTDPIIQIGNYVLPNEHMYCIIHRRIEKIEQRLALLDSANGEAAHPLDESSRNRYICMASFFDG